MYKRIIPMFILYADNNDVEDISRMCMVLPRNFYRYVDYRKRRKNEEGIISSIQKRRKIFI